MLAAITPAGARPWPAPFVGLNVRPADGRRAVALDIVRAVADAVAAGRLPAGCRLPPVRALEHQLGISKNTVQAAYDELAARGLLLARERDGVFVAAPTAEHAPAAPAFHPRRPELAPIGLDTTPVPPGVLSLSTVFIDPALLPIERLQDCFRSVLAQPGLRPFYDPRGHRPLREAIARRLVARGMDVAPDDVLITSGSQQALDLVGRTLARKRVALEDPVYAQARLMFDNHGASVLGLPSTPSPPASTSTPGSAPSPPSGRRSSTPSRATRTRPATPTPRTSSRPCSPGPSGTASASSRTTGAPTCSPAATSARPSAPSAGATSSTSTRSRRRSSRPSASASSSPRPSSCPRSSPRSASPPSRRRPSPRRPSASSSSAATTTPTSPPSRPPSTAATTPASPPSPSSCPRRPLDDARRQAHPVARDAARGRPRAPPGRSAGARRASRGVLGAVRRSPHLNGFRVSYAFLTEGDMRRALGVVREALEVSTT
ncbi:MAG: GntR family transcriptional regulator [Deltaproteobacteria bacterium]|nr:GntR family transcriptional regulator [Deltaproteobacteria bacterium]